MEMAMTTGGTTDLCFMSAAALLTAYRGRELSPVEVAEAVLERIERLNPRLGAYLTVDTAGALAAARAAEAAYLAGNAGPLAGVLTGIKDLANTAGLRTTYGSLLYREFVPEEDDIVVRRLRVAGAVFPGKTNTPEFGSLPICENRLGEPARNPWDTRRTPGGSSGGSAAAVAAGLGPLATGSDFGGSIRMPAALCGVFGFKPTLGRLPIDTRRVLTGDYFTHEGPISRTVLDAALFLDATAGPDPRDRFSQLGAPPAFAANLGRLPRGLRVAWTPDLGYQPADREVVAVCERAVGRFADVVGTIDAAAPSGIEEGIAGWLTAGRGAGYDAEQLAYRSAPGHVELLTGPVRGGLDRLDALSLRDFLDAVAKVRAWRASVAGFFERYDLLLTPTMPVPPLATGTRELVVDGELQSSWFGLPSIFGLVSFTSPFNITGTPAATVPCGTTPDGLPVGLQIAGRFGDDLLVMQAAHRFEQAFPWSERRPPLALGGDGSTV
jgi:aspartyl-tRNA(Asn)/glutamyl-tRNA(Gln) amidotransferase subunit A